MTIVADEIAPEGVLEKHILTEYADLEVSVDVYQDGRVDVWIGNENISPDTLGRIVEFVEQHGQVTVVSGSRD